MKKRAFGVNKLVVLGLLVLLVLFGLFVNKKNTSAQEVLPLTVFPATQEREVTPGQPVHTQVQFKNNSASFISGTIHVVDYVINDKDGTPTIVENGALKPKYGAAAWIKANYEAVTIAPTDFVTIDLAVNPPQEIDTCGRYALVYFESQGTNLNFPGVDKASSTAVTSRLGALLNFKVKKSDCREGLQISRMESAKFLEYGPVTVSFDLLNQGDYDVKPKGVVTSTNLFGRTSYEQTVKEQRVFPETAKVYEASVGRKWMFGKYKINLMVNYGQNGGRVERSIEVWVFPWKITLIIILSLVVLYVLLKTFYNKTVAKEEMLEVEVAKEKEQIEKLKQELRNRKE